MKKFFSLLLLISLVANLQLLQAQSTADVKLTWTASTTPLTGITGYVCRERFGAGTIASPYTYGPILFSTTNIVLTGTVINVASGTHTYIVRGVNNNMESGDSNAVVAVIGITPLPPSGVVFTITINP
jgi:hypothetical protein